MSGMRIRPALADDQAQQAVAVRQIGPIALALVGRDPARDEALDAAVRVDDAERRVARPDERRGRVDDELEDLLESRRPAIARAASSSAVERGASSDVTAVTAYRSEPCAERSSVHRSATTAPGERADWHCRRTGAAAER